MSVGRMFTGLPGPGIRRHLVEVRPCGDVSAIEVRIAGVARELGRKLPPADLRRAYREYRRAVARRPWGSTVPFLVRAVVR